MRFIHTSTLLPTNATFRDDSGDRDVIATCAGNGKSPERDGNFHRTFQFSSSVDRYGRGM
jgi:hypothetical protein